jgi:hypothetical protein
VIRNIFNLDRKAVNHLVTKRFHREEYGAKAGEKEIQIIRNILAKIYLKCKLPKEKKFINYNTE